MTNPSDNTARGWRPIATQPKDGRKVLVYRPLAHLTHDPHIKIAGTRPAPNHCWHATIPEGRDGLNFTDGACYATHWMPIPDAPEEINDVPI